MPTIKKFKNPYYNDTNASVSIALKGNKWIATDFGNKDEYCGDYIDWAKHQYGQNYITELSKKYGLPFNKTPEEYWIRYRITSQDLRQIGIKSNGKGYIFKEGDYEKKYNPFGGIKHINPKGIPKVSWWSCGALSKGHVAFIVEGPKDGYIGNCFVKRMGLIWGFYAIIDASVNLSDVENQINGLKANFKKVIYVGDSDEAGLKCAEQFKSIVSVSPLTNYKDFGELIENISDQEVKEVMVNLIPILPEYSHMKINPQAQKSMLQKREKALIRADKEEVKPFTFWKINGEAGAVMGEVITITGKAKSRKTYLLSAFVIEFLRPGTIGQGFSVEKPHDKPRIVWIDTEQGRYWTKNILNRVEKAGISKDEIDRHLVFYNCRQFSIEELKALVAYETEINNDVCALIIDGSRDLVTSINSEEESISMAKWFLELADRYGIALINILHLNKTDSNPRGHLGTELMNKSFVVMEVEKDKGSDLSQVKAALSRSTLFEDLYIMIDANGLPVVADAPVKTDKGGKNEYLDLEMNHLKKFVRDIFRLNSEYDSKSKFAMAIKEKLKKDFGWSYGRDKVEQEVIPYLENNKLIISSGGEKRGQSITYKLDEFANVKVH